MLIFTTLDYFKSYYVVRVKLKQCLHLMLLIPHLMTPLACSDHTKFSRLMSSPLQKL